MSFFKRSSILIILVFKSLSNFCSCFWSCVERYAYIDIFSLVRLVSLVRNVLKLHFLNIKRVTKLLKFYTQGEAYVYNSKREQKRRDKFEV